MIQVLRDHQQKVKEDKIKEIQERKIKKEQEPKETAGTQGNHAGSAWPFMVAHSVWTSGEEYEV